MNPCQIVPTRGGGRDLCFAFFSASPTRLTPYRISRTCRQAVDNHSLVPKLRLGNAIPEAPLPVSYNPDPGRTRSWSFKYGVPKPELGNQQITLRKIGVEIEERGNEAWGIDLAGMLIAFAIILRASIAGPFTGWLPGLHGFAVYFLAGLVFLLAYRFVAKIAGWYRPLISTMSDKIL
ncbi:MAG: DUF350 domain-containing protein [Syntrophobacteraceae bacterium]